MSAMLTSPTSVSSSSYALSIEAPTPTASPNSSPTTKRCTPAVVLSIVLLTSLLLALAITLPLVLSRSSSSSPSPTPLTVTYARPSNSSLWAVSARAPPSSAHTFHWLFPQRNLDWLSSEFDALTTPTSPRFQQWHSLDSLHAQLAPPASDKAAVLVYLTQGGVAVSGITDHGDALQVETTVDVVESLFSTRLHVMTHVESGKEAVRSVDGTAAVPVDVAPLLERLQGVTEYPHPVYHLTTHRVAAAHAFHPMQTEETNAQCSRVSSYYALAPPSLLVSAYNFTDRSTVTTPSPTRNMVTAFGGQAMSVPDLAHFQVNVGARAPFNATIVNAATNTANLASSGIGTEANLDIQAVFQIAPTANNSFYASTSSGSLLAAMQAITSMPVATRPQVVSISYGFGASDYNYHASDAGRTDTQFQQMGVLGITVIASSGDDGTAGPYNRGCSLSPNSLGYGTITPLASTPFLPGYPAASPYVLSVGETDFLASATSSSAAYGAFSTSVRSPPECYNCPADQNGVAFLCQATNLGEQPVSAGAKSGIAGQTSGGGFSTVYSTPSWQSSQVRGYFGNCTSANGCTLPPSTYYTSTNRGYPDVAVFGGEFGIVANGKESVVGGTSVAAPLLAGLISRLNEVQLARKGTTLGFVNPLLYAAAVSKPSTFHDLKTGENACPQSNSACATFYQKGTGSTTCSGFYSAPGWDPVTGLGSPNIGQLIDYLNTH